MRVKLMGALLALGLMAGCGGVEEDLSAGTNAAPENGGPEQMAPPCQQQCYNQEQLCLRYATTFEEQYHCYEVARACFALCRTPTPT